MFDSDYRPMGCEWLSLGEISPLEGAVKASRASRSLVQKGLGFPLGNQQEAEGGLRKLI